MQHIAKGTEELHIKSTDLIHIPVYVVIAYLFNPYTIFNCVAQTTTVWSNVFLAGFFYFMAQKQLFLCCLCLALETQRNFYPIALIVPAALYFSEGEANEKDSSDLVINTTFKWKDIFGVVTIFAVILTATHFAAYSITQDWSFLDATYGFMYVENAEINYTN